MSKKADQIVKMKDIKEFVRRVVLAFKPQKIILFGSYAYGWPEEASDVDILVIIDTPLRPIEQAIKIRKNVKAPFPMDLIVRTPKQIAERLCMGDFLLRKFLLRAWCYMKPLTEEWIRKAEEDYRVARREMEAEPPS